MTPSSRIFELRTYHAAAGKFDALQDRFRNHTLALFEKHGFDVIGFWIPLDAEGGPTNTLVYLLAFSDRDAAKKAWSTFLDDPAWIKAKADSEKDGALLTAKESVFLQSADYSPLS